MKNYWKKEVTKASFLTEITTAFNLSTEERNEISDNIGDVLNYYILFEKGELKCFLAFDGNKSVFPTQLPLTSSIYDSENNKNDHILTVIHPESKEELGKYTFVEDFENHVLLKNDGESVVGFTFASDVVSLEIYPSVDEPPTPLAKSLCCAACSIVHAAIGISSANCICCWYIGGCGFSCYFEV